MTHAFFCMSCGWNPDCGWKHPYIWVGGGSYMKISTLKWCQSTSVRARKKERVKSFRRLLLVHLRLLHVGRWLFYFIGVSWSFWRVGWLVEMGVLSVRMDFSQLKTRFDSKNWKNDLCRMENIFNRQSNKYMTMINHEHFTGQLNTKQDSNDKKSDDMVECSKSERYSLNWIKILKFQSVWRTSFRFEVDLKTKLPAEKQINRQ
jgi:hypothetical protein